VEGNRLHVIITYDFDDGQRFEEKALFRQHPELIQESWSWKEFKNGKLSRQFTADFSGKTSTALLRGNNEAKQFSQNVEIESGRTFAGFGFTTCGFVRATWEFRSS